MHGFLLEVLTADWTCHMVGQLEGEAAEVYRMLGSFGQLMLAHHQMSHTTAPPPQLLLT